MGTLTRRSILRGMMRGSAVVVGLPLLDIFLDGNGEALAAGAPIPTRFGTWFWGCGVNTARWFPDKVGANYDIKEELSPIAPFRDKVSVFSNFNCILDGKPNLVHWSGAMATCNRPVYLARQTRISTTTSPTWRCLPRFSAACLSRRRGSLFT